MLNFIPNLFLIASVFAAPNFSKDTDLSKQKIFIGDAKCEQKWVELEVQLAKTYPSQTKGLSGRKKPMGKNEGMLFIFEKPELLNFWMKDTHIPLEISFFDAKGKFIRADEMKVEKKPSAPLANYSSESLALYALENATQTVQPLLRTHPDLYLCKNGTQNLPLK